MSDYELGDAGVLTLRDSLSDGTLRQLSRLEAAGGLGGGPLAAAGRAALRAPRRALEIAGLPLEGQRELLGRFRMASADERRAVQRILAEHVRVRHPDVEL